MESGVGKSELAVKANNHFGIKCHNDWDGERVYHDDDKKNECFRKYDRAEDSFNDHSLFLKNKSRYAFLFELDRTDYKGWAKGLKQAGYATDPNYAKRLITLIEENNLQRFDTESYKTTSSDAKTPVKQQAIKNNQETFQGTYCPDGDTQITINGYIRKLTPNGSGNNGTKKIIKKDCFFQTGHIK